MPNYKYVQTREGQIHARQEGSGPPLLLLHNIARSMAVFERLIPILAKDFLVVAVDIPGLGRSYRPTIPFVIADVARGLSDLVGALADQSGQDVAIYGHRYGATLAAELAAGGSNPIRAVVLSDYALIRSDEERQEWLAKAAVETSGGPAGLPAVLSEPDGSHLMRLWHRGYQRLMWGRGGFGPMDEMTEEDMHFVNTYVIDTIVAGPYGEQSFAAAFRYPSALRLPEIGVPALVMHGTVGFEVPICQRSDEVAALIPGARTAEVSGDAHMVYFEPHEVAEVVRGFLLP